MEKSELKKVLNTIVRISSNLNKEELFKIFNDTTDGIKEHLWEKFSIKCKHEALDFYYMLDADKGEQFLNYMLNKVNS